MPNACPDTAGVEAVRQRWAEAFNAGDLSTLLALYHPQAVLWGTTSPVLLETPEGIAAYFRQTLSVQPAPRVEMGQARVRLIADVALCNGTYALHLSSPTGEARALPARFSFAFARVAEVWLIVDHHSSAMP